MLRVEVVGRDIGIGLEIETETVGNAIVGNQAGTTHRIDFVVVEDEVTSETRKGIEVEPTLGLPTIEEIGDADHIVGIESKEVELEPAIGIDQATPALPATEAEAHSLNRRELTSPSHLGCWREKIEEIDLTYSVTNTSLELQIVVRLEIVDNVTIIK